MEQAVQAVINKQILLKKLPSGVAFAIFDSPGKSNHLTASVVSEFADLLKEVENDSSIKALGIISNKPDSFILGADLKEILQFKCEEDAYKLSTTGQKLFNQLANLSKPTIAGVHGTCLGGGLELILCCGQRIATTSENTILGLPEVRLGLLPGLGGTQRLPRLIQLKDALELILLAEPIKAERALEIGLLDKLVEKENLESSIEEAALQMLANKHSKVKAEPVAITKQQETTIATFRRSVRMRTKGRYPAQLKALDAVQKGLTEGIEQGLKEEAQAFAELALSDISHNLISLFFGTEIARHSALSLANKDGIQAVRTVGIIGGGLMGLGLARLSALSGFRVLFRPLRKETASIAFELLVDSVQKSAERNRLEGLSNPAENLVLVDDDSLFGQADIIFEAGPENTPQKVEMFRSLKRFAKPDAVLATITSSLSIADMKEQIETEGALIGVHFFYPVEKMPLVEIAAPPSTSRADLGKVSGFIAELGKIPVYVKDSPCFLVNRLLCCYLLEAARLAEAGVPLDWLETAALDFGMPMGPLALLDEVGLDVAVMVAETLNLKFGERATLPTVLTKLKHSGYKGKKSGEGIYLWDETGKRQGFNPELITMLSLNTATTTPSAQDLTQLAEQMVLPMIDEAARCLEEKVVRRAREIDLATILGIGFPPFRGGLLRYADSLGSAHITRELEHIYAKTSPVRTISDTLKKQASGNSKFFPISLSAE